jgi:hypothetical protein
MRSKKIASPICLSKNELVKEYYSWLCNLISITQPTRSYNLLTEKLHNTRFYWSIANDDNRAFEGRNLRELFCEGNNIEYIYDYFDAGCSILELLVALAYRCESIMVDQYGDMPMPKWYWEMLGNIGLNKFTDEVYYELDGNLNVDQILTRINDRKYKRNGQGGLFPLNHAKKDQQLVELWYQMSAYLVENYYDEN